MVLVIIGSPKIGGNSEFVGRKILEGVDGELVRLGELDIEWFDGDKDCGDGMAGLVAKIIETDNIIFITPSYFSNVPGILKNVMDRTNKQYYSREFEGKKAAVIALGGGPERSVKKAADAVAEYCRIQGIEVVGSLVLSTGDMPPGEQPEEFLERIQEFKKSLEGKLF